MRDELDNNNGTSLFRRTKCFVVLQNPGVCVPVLTWRTGHIYIVLNPNSITNQMVLLASGIEWCTTRSD